MKTPVLETDRLILRPVCLDDAPSIQKHFNNWEIIQYLNRDVPWPYPERGAEDFLKTFALPAMEKGEKLIWAITPKEGKDKGLAIGLIEYRLEGQIKDSDRGFWLSAQYHGQGLMSEAIIATQNYIFSELSIDKITVVNNVDNPASKKVKEKTGAQFVKCIKGQGWDGEIEKEVWEVTKENWEKLRK